MIRTLVAAKPVFIAFVLVAWGPAYAQTDTAMYLACQSNARVLLKLCDTEPSKRGPGWGEMFDGVAARIPRDCPSSLLNAPMPGDAPAEWKAQKPVTTTDV